MKIAKNNCFGGFGVTEDVYKELGFDWNGYGYLSNEDFGIEDDNYYLWRADSRLIDAIESIGVNKASSSLAEIVVVDVPDDVGWFIDEYDGIETIRESHRTW